MVLRSKGSTFQQNRLCRDGEALQRIRFCHDGCEPNAFECILKGGFFDYNNIAKGICIMKITVAGVGLS